MKHKYYLSNEFPNFKENYSHFLDFLLQSIKLSKTLGNNDDFNNLIIKTVRLIKSRIYNDIDTKCNVYYDDLTKYLTKRENEYKDKNLLKGEYVYISPCEVNKINYYNSKNKRIKLSKTKITVLEKHDNYYEYKFKLSSDTFGFTANPISIAKKVFSSPTDDIYPISKILVQYANNDLVNINFEQAKEIITKFIYESRTIAGSFLWPSNINSYNRSRGINDYIEDRVDITLYEIKNHFTKKDISTVLGNINRFQKEKEWLSHFGDSFNTYIDFFQLNDFVIKDNDGEYYPKSIITNDKLNEEVLKKHKKELKFKTADELLDIYKNLNNMINNRNNNL